MPLAIFPTSNSYWIAYLTFEKSWYIFHPMLNMLQKHVENAKYNDFIRFFLFFDEQTKTIHSQYYLKYFIIHVVCRQSQTLLNWTRCGGMEHNSNCPKLTSLYSENRCFIIFRLSCKCILYAFFLSFPFPL